MARYIDADKLKDAFHTDTEHLQSRDEHLFDLIMFEIDETPTADVVEVKHGEWVYWQPDGTNHLWNCSVCGGAISTPMKFVADHIKYCEHCGAKMDLKEGADNE